MHHGDSDPYLGVGGGFYVLESTMSCPPPAEPPARRPAVQLYLGTAQVTFGITEKVCVISCFVWLSCVDCACNMVGGKHGKSIVSPSKS